MKRIISFQWLLLSAVLMTLSLEGSIETLDRRVEAVMEAFDLPGVAIGVVAKDQVLLAKGYGVKEVGQEGSVSEKTLFGLASGTKPFTAYLLVKLADEGLLNLDDPVVKYLPEFRLKDKALSDKITIKHLLTHRSGLPRHDLMWYGAKYSREELLDRLQHLDAVAEPGEVYHYSNIMLTLAGMVAERVLETSFENALQNQILIPLAMEGTNSGVEKLLASPDWAKPHVWTKGSVIPIEPRECLTAPASSMNINVEEGCKWLQTMLKEPCVEEMLLAHAPGSPDSVNWFTPTGHGLGWKLGDYHGRKVAFHGGHLEGYISLTAFLPEEKIGVIILVNNSAAGFHSISVLSQDILSYLLGLTPPNKLESEKALYEMEKKAIPVYVETDENLSFFKPLSGDYHHPAYGKLVIEVVGDTPTLLLNDLPYGLVRTGEKTFVVTSRVLAFPHFKWQGEVQDDGSLALKLEPAAKPLLFR